MLILKLMPTSTESHQLTQLLCNNHADLETHANIRGKPSINTAPLKPLATIMLILKLMRTSTKAINQHSFFATIMLILKLMPTSTESRQSTQLLCNNHADLETHANTHTHTESHQLTQLLCNNHDDLETHANTHGKPSINTASLQQSCWS